MQLEDSVESCTYNQQSTLKPSQSYTGVETVLYLMVETHNQLL